MHLLQSPVLFVFVYMLWIVLRFSHPCAAQEMVCIQGMLDKQHALVKSKDAELEDMHKNLELKKEGACLTFPSLSSLALLAENNFSVLLCHARCLPVFSRHRVQFKTETDLRCVRTRSCVPPKGGWAASSFFLENNCRFWAWCVQAVLLRPRHWIWTVRLQLQWASFASQCEMLQFYWTVERRMMLTWP